MDTTVFGAAKAAVMGIGLTEWLEESDPDPVYNGNEASTIMADLILTL
jgi:hypothetical protein